MDRLDPAVLLDLSRRCLTARPSRLLDGRIYCAVHGLADANALGDTRLIDARANGFVMIHQDGVAGWVDAPPFTVELERATSLLPASLVTISRNPLIVCATAPGALALISRTTDVPPGHTAAWRTRAAMAAIERALPSQADRRMIQPPGRDGSVLRTATSANVFDNETSQSMAIKDFADQMVADHTRALPCWSPPISSSSMR